MISFENRLIDNNIFTLYRFRDLFRFKKKAIILLLKVVPQLRIKLYSFLDSRRYFQT